MTSKRGDDWDPAWGDPDTPSDAEWERQAQEQVAAEKQAKREARAEKDRRQYPRNLVLMGILLLVYVAIVSSGGGELPLLAVLIGVLGVGLIVAGAIVAGVRQR